eukprot:Polyplicarium_translucidae@DN3329_c1_g4_i1.p1
MKNMAARIGSGIERLGLCSVSHFDEEPVETAKRMRVVATLLPNRLEWTLLDAAANAYGFTMCPCYVTLSKEAIVFIVTQIKATSLFTNSSCLETAMAVGESCKGVVSIVSINEESASAKEEASRRGLKLIGWRELLAAGEEPLPFAPATRDHVQTICYTSGTTGKPKGVLITHEMWIEAVLGMVEGPLSPASPHCPIDEESVMYSYLPIAHCFERHCNYWVIYRGGRIGISCGEVSRMLEEIKMLNPTFLPTVPRICTRFRDVAMEEVAKMSRLRRVAFYAALRLKQASIATNPMSDHPLWDAAVFSSFRSMLGSRMRFFVNGGAVLDPVVQAELRAIFSITVFTGYGMTESTGGCMIVRGHDAILGHDGAPIRGVQLRLRSVKEMNCSVHDNPPRGELLIRGKQVTPGYFLNPSATSEGILAGGWLRSGDVARRNQDGTFKIIDRAKAVFKLSQGEYVSPERIEGIYSRAALIGQIYCHGESDKNYLVGLVVPAPSASVRWAESSAKSPDVGSLCKDREFQEAVLEQMEEEATVGELRGFEKIKKIRLIEEPFSVENGLLTATMKLKRPDMRETFSVELRALYDEHVTAKGTTVKSS